MFFYGLIIKDLEDGFLSQACLANRQIDRRFVERQKKVTRK